MLLVLLDSPTNTYTFERLYLKYANFFCIDCFLNKTCEFCHKFYNFNHQLNYLMFRVVTRSTLHFYMPLNNMQCR